MPIMLDTRRKKEKQRERERERERDYENLGTTRRFFWESVSRAFCVTVYAHVRYMIYYYLSNLFSFLRLSSATR